MKKISHTPLTINLSRSMSHSQNINSRFRQKLTKSSNLESMKAWRFIYNSKLIELILLEISYRCYYSFFMLNSTIERHFFLFLAFCKHILPLLFLIRQVQKIKRFEGNNLKESGFGGVNSKQIDVKTKKVCFEW